MRPTLRARAEPAAREEAATSHHFVVSRASALYRLKNLRFMTQTELDRLQAEVRAQGSSVAHILGLGELDAPGERNEFRHRFLGLALEAWRRELISRGQLNELGALVDVPQGEIDRLLADTGSAPANT